MRFSLHRVLRLLLIAIVLPCSTSGGAAQSIGKWIAPFAEQLFPLFSEEDRTLLLSTPSEETTITDLLGTAWSVKRSTQRYICLASDSTITEELALLPHKRGYILCHLRTLKTPTHISLLSFRNKEGAIIANGEFLPSVDGSNFLLPSVEKTGHAYRSVEQLLSQLPMRYVLSAEKQTLQLYPEYTSHATEEQKAILKQLLAPTPIVLEWSKKGFIPKQ